MKLSALFTGLFFLLCATVTAQYRYGLNPTGYGAYLVSLTDHPEKELVDLEKYIPGLVLDIRYATTNNFTKERIYDRARAYARRPVAYALKKVQTDLSKKGLGIKVFDAYRPYKATVKFYEVYGDTTYVASPYRGSRHNRGCALDITLIDLRSGKELKMPTGYDSFTRQAWPSTPVSDPEVRNNLQVLIQVMEKYGFRVNSSEWWHYDFTGWKNFEVLDIDFHQLEVH
ncbi:MAG TPA: M15 family metallopeptidase [Chryseosolibacter sp.]|nr:M15 family metallopeptidase [Chryseosolibacter sp.]